MGSDRARNSHDAHQQYRSVVAQQGRVVIEADLNEATEIQLDEQRHEALDFVGPRGTPDDGYAVSFHAELTSDLPNDFLVGPGTLYVGGLRVTRPDTLAFPHNSYWGQMRNEWVDGPDVPDLQSTRELICLHLSEREVSAVEDEALRDVALGGPDTSQRTRLVQHIVRVPLDGRITTCEAALDAAREQWESAGLGLDLDTMRLMPTSQLVVGHEAPTQGEDSACEPAAQAGYLGAENQLLRVQVSQKQTLLWGPDNGSHLYRVELFNQGRKLRLKTSPPDAFLYPREGQVAEVLRATVQLDNGQYMAAPTGITFKLGTNPYEPNERLLTLGSAPLPDEHLDPELTPALFVRIWEEELDPDKHEGPMPLGHTGLNVQVIEGKAVPGEYWMFAVRPGTPQEFYPARFQGKAPQSPDGPRQWICPLALISWDDGAGTVVTDCRPPFDNLVELTARVKALEERPVGGGCCSVTLGPEDLKELSLQQHIDQLVEDRPRGSHATVCLKAGLYHLEEPLRLGSQHDELTINGCEGSVLMAHPSQVHRFLDGIVVVEKTRRVILRGLEFRLLPVSYANAVGALLASLPISALQTRSGTPLVQFMNALRLAVGVRWVKVSSATVEGCLFDASALAQDPSFSVGIFANDTCTDVTVRDNHFQALDASVTAGQEWQRMSFGYLHAPSTVFLPTTPPSTPFTQESTIRGALSAPRLDGATFEGNQFSHLSAAIFIQVDPGSVLIRGNRVRDGYAGFWLMTLHASAYAGVTDPAEISRRRTSSELRALLTGFDQISTVDSAPFPRMYNAAVTLATDPLLLVASTLARGYPLPASSQHLLVPVTEATAGATFILESVKQVALQAAQAASWNLQMGEVDFAVASRYSDMNVRFGPLHRLLAALEQATSPSRPAQAVIHLSDNRVDTSHPNPEPSASSLTVWDAEKLPLQGPPSSTNPQWSVMVDANHCTTTSLLQPTARILNVEQAVLTGNILHNRIPTTIPGVMAGVPTVKPAAMAAAPILPWSCLLVPTKAGGINPTTGYTATSLASMAVTGNVFFGQAALPLRNDYSNLPWPQLNTIRLS